MKTSRVMRVVRLLTALQSGQEYSAERLAKLFDISRRTVFRDLKELQWMGVPYRYDNRKASYVIDPEFFLPPIDLNLKEALSILLLIHKARHQVQLPYKTSAVLAALKIENNLPASIRKYCKMSLQNISARMPPHSPMSELDKTFDELQKAVTEKHKMQIVYHSLHEQSQISTEICPYHLLYNRRAWYVLGWSAAHKSTRTFKLSRIKSLRMLKKRFVDDGSFDVYEYLGKAWSMIPEGKIYNVELKFAPKVASNVAEVIWHSTQEVSFSEDGSAIVRFRVDGLNEISWWILGYGDQVQVLSPKALRKRITEVAKNIIKHYQKP